MFNRGDGANWQAQAVLAYLSAQDGLDNYIVPEVNRWHNCREQGYIISLRSKDYRRQLNICFYEHRNSDRICAQKWEQLSLNPITIDTMDNNHPFISDKYHADHWSKYGNIVDMGEWIVSQLEDFVQESSN